MTGDDNWVGILNDAEEALRQTKARQSALRRSIRTIRSKIAKGDPFPLDAQTTEYKSPLAILTCIPYALDWNLGRAYNEIMESLPLDGWACLLDHDASFTTSIWYRQLVDAIEREPEGTFTAMTNRIGQIEEDADVWQQVQGIDRANHDIVFHRSIGAEMVEIPHLLDVTDRRFMAGVMILISRESWCAMGGFRDGLRGVDYAAHIALKKAGRRVFCIQGLYLYHWKRGDGSKFSKGTPLHNWREDLEPGDPRRLVTTVST